MTRPTAAARPRTHRLNGVIMGAVLVVATGVPGSAPAHTQLCDATVHVGLSRFVLDFFKISAFGWASCNHSGVVQYDVCLTPHAMCATWVAEGDTAAAETQSELCIDGFYGAIGGGKGTAVHGQDVSLAFEPLAEYACLPKMIP